MEAWLNAVNTWVWGPPLLFLLVGTGIWLSLRIGFLQIRQLGRALRLTFRRGKNDPGDISHFQALMTALAATIGTGNIVGVATAIGVGGPGAMFWMWVTALFGMATKYAEAVLAVRYRTRDDRGEMAGGPMYYLALGLRQPWMGAAFAIFGSVAAFGIGNMVQANSVAVALQNGLHIAPGISGLVMTGITGLVVLGGIRRIGEVSAWLVPWMAVIYIGACLVILFRHAGAIPSAFAIIFHDAFTGSAAVGGFAGSTIMIAARMGVARGLFSNEAGLGSAPIAAAAARTPHPVQQALVSMTGTFIDTIVVCSMTGLALVATGVWRSGAQGVELTHAAFSAGLPGIGGGVVLTIGIALFAFSTILGWAYYGERCVYYLLGRKSITPYRVLWTVAVGVGAMMKLGLVWTLSDILNALMAVPNLIGLLLLSGEVARLTRDYFARIGEFEPD